MIIRRINFLSIRLKIDSYYSGGWVLSDPYIHNLDHMCKINTRYNSFNDLAHDLFKEKCKTNTRIFPVFYSEKYLIEFVNYINSTFLIYIL